MGLNLTLTETCTWSQLVSFLSLESEPIFGISIPKARRFLWFPCGHESEREGRDIKRTAFRSSPFPFLFVSAASRGFAPFITRHQPKAIQTLPLRNVCSSRLRANLGKKHIGNPNQSIGYTVQHTCWGNVLNPIKSKEGKGGLSLRTRKMIKTWRKARYSYNRIHNRKPNETNKQVKTTSPMFATWPRLSRLSQTHHSDIFWCETFFGKLWNLFGGVSKQKVLISNLCFGLWPSHSCQVVSNLVWASLLLANTLTYTQTTRTLISYEGRVFLSSTIFNRPDKFYFFCLQIWSMVSLHV